MDHMTRWSEFHDFLATFSLVLLQHFKDLCVARCIHTLESGNCTSRGDWDGCHLSMITKRFDPI